jgi:hypothetical protein
MPMSEPVPAWASGKGPLDLVVGALGFLRNKIDGTRAKPQRGRNDSAFRTESVARLGSSLSGKTHTNRRGK